MVQAIKGSKLLGEIQSGCTKEMGYEVFGHQV